MPQPTQPEAMTLNISAEVRQRDCAAQHFGPWMIEPHWFAQAVSAVNAGTLKPDRVMDPDSPDESPRELYERLNGLAIISIEGPMMKGDSSFGGTSTVRTRRALRVAAADEGVSGIVLHIDSPGGTVAGNADLAQEVRVARKKKPVRAHISDLGASAAYWIASQCERITANDTAMVGSIGTVAVVRDYSEMFGKDGVKVHVVSTGKFKGAFAPGSEVTEEQIAELQQEVDDLNEHFLAAVVSGRQMTRERLEAIADGRVFIAAKAKRHGLIDAVTSFDAAITSFRKEITAMELTEFQAFAAAHPEAALELPFIKTEIGKQHDDGFKAGAAKTSQMDKDRLTALKSLPGATAEFAIEQFLAGNDIDKAAPILAAQVAKENAELKAQLAAAQQNAGQKPVAGDPADKPALSLADKAAADWDANPELQQEFPKKALYVQVMSQPGSASA